jgi:hypothetical protein
LPDAEHIALLQELRAVAVQLPPEESSSEIVALRLACLFGT